MLTYKALLDDASKLLYESSDTPRIDAEVLMQHVIGQPLAWLIAYGDTIATADHVKAFCQLADARKEGNPIAYLTGSRDFWSLTLKVNEHVLIPRPDTETLVEEALQRLPKDSELAILDLGTGSGAIALSLAKERPQARVLAIDSEAGALGVARENADLNNIDNVEFLLSNWFDALGDRQAFNLIAANPPYVEPDDPHLQRGDLRFEPDSALIANGHGLSDLSRIIETAPQYLSVQGFLIVEHGYNQAQDVAALFHANGFDEITLFTDINDLPRCTIGRLHD